MAVTRETLKKKPFGAALPALPASIESLDSLSARPAVRNALRVFSRERRWIDERHLELCRIPAATFFEQARAEWISGQFASLGWEVRQDRAGNVLATWPAAPKDCPLIAVTAHLDTVLSPQKPEEIRVEGRDRFCGPGVSDNGAGLAGLLALARAWAESPDPLASSTPAAPLLVANVGEEGEGNLSGMRFLCRQPHWVSRIRGFLVLDGPAIDHLTFEALACRRFEIQVSGPGGHSWSDFGAANAVHALARAITWFGEARAASKPAARLSWNFGSIDGGASVNSIPASARAKVDLRSVDPAVLDLLADELAEILERALRAENELATQGRVTARIKETGSRPGGRLQPDAPLLQWAQAVDAFLGVRSVPDCASTDANVPLSMGLPALSIGAGGQGGGAHTPDEWYSPDGRETGLRRVYLLLLLMLAGAGAA